VTTRLTQGCVPLTPPHVVTEGERNIIVSLDGRPALDVLREDIGAALGRDLHRAAQVIHAGLPVKGSTAVDTGVEIAGITDGFVGKAPDLGAYELGGPRWTAGADWRDPQAPPIAAIVARTMLVANPQPRENGGDPGCPDARHSATTSSASGESMTVCFPVPQPRSTSRQKRRPADSREISAR
jgi:hypothetical protein